MSEKDFIVVFKEHDAQDEFYEQMETEGKTDENKFRINLKNNIDAVFKDICIQIIGRSEFEKESIDMIVNNRAAAQQQPLHLACFL